MTDSPRRLRVAEAEAGRRLDRILADRWPDTSRNLIQKAFAADGVLVDGRARPKSFRPAAGAEVAVALPAPVEMSAAPEDIPLVIVYEDEHLLVIDKPADLVVHPAPGHPGGTLVNALLHHDRRLADAGQPLRPGIVHRLDRGTSGLLVVARTPQAHLALAAQLRDRSLGRSYLALSWGQWQEPAGELSGAIGRHRGDRRRMAVLVDGGRPALTRYLVREDLAFVQLCRVDLQTGRTHQIRVHFAHFGHPLVGDPLYGDPRRAQNTRAVDRTAAARLVRAASRQLLHAAELRLLHPADRRPLRFQAPLPADFAGALAGLRRDLGRPDQPPDPPPDPGPPPDDRR
jgi:23S rRNA pseudouridine1911/1915/1917 synthase